MTETYTYHVPTLVSPFAERVSSEGFGNDSGSVIGTGYV
jgi:hypothetical protein